MEGAEGAHVCIDTGGALVRYSQFDNNGHPALLISRLTNSGRIDQYRTLQC